MGKSRKGKGGKMSRYKELKENLPEGFGMDDYSPGDGVTRYRFFDREPFGYFAGRGIYTALGIKEAETFVAGLWAAYYAMMEREGRV
jgi:hypothetical protein